MCHVDSRAPRAKNFARFYSRGWPAGPEGGKGEKGGGRRKTNDARIAFGGGATNGQPASRRAYPGPDFPLAHPRAPSLFAQFFVQSPQPIKRECRPRPGADVSRDPADTHCSPALNPSSESRIGSGTHDCVQREHQAAPEIKP
ncbi:hypothetical protein RR42_s1150 [Cupriavidus basilensis]|uniref:Uncharacterized protein n=1 Tax=Cupriavidus basilensis TaxID=68895 RepID=A0A0C4YL71_9BURK|nr:hypothetical protein RR42_s1150 [Cupriavidus basilensis]